MRTLDAALTAAQKLDSRPPAPKLVLTYGEIEHTYSTERITIIEQLEEQFRHRATIQLDNADNYLDDYNYNGYTATIYDGLITKEGAKYSNSAPMTVISQKYESSEGRLVCVLDLRGIPDMLIDDHASDNYLPDDEDTKTVKDLIREIAGDTGVTHLSVFNHCTKYDVIFDSEDDLIDSYVPKSGFRIYDNGNRLAALKRLLDYTHCVMRFGSDGKLHILVPTTTGTDYDSEYSLAYGQHSFFSKAYRQSIVIPNYITVKSLADDDPQYSGTAKSSASYALLPKKSWVKCKLESDDQAKDIAEAIQAKYELAAEMGSAFVPMNAGQEIFDYIKVTDSRNGDARTGNIGSLRKVWKAATERRSSQYYMQFSFGGWFNTDALWKDLETFGGGIASNSGLERLSVKDLYAEKIQADSLDMVWIDPEGNIDLSQIGDTLDNLPDGENYARVKSTHIEAGDIKLTEYAVYQDGYDPSEKRRVFTSQPTVPYDVGDLWTQDGFVRRCTNAKTSEQSYSSGDWATIDQDDIPNGTSYRRVKSTSVTTDGIVILDQVQTGTYGLVLATDIAAGHIKLTEHAVYQDGYDPSEKRRVFTSQPTVPYDVGDLWTQDGFVKRCTTAKTSAQAYSAGDWTAIDQDDIPNGSSFRRVKSTSVTTDGVVILDQVQTGTYGLVLATDIAAGHIKLSTASGTIDDIDDGTTYSKVKSTQIEAGKIVLNSGIYVDEDQFVGGSYDELTIDSTGVYLFDGQIYFEDGDSNGSGSIRFNDTTSGFWVFCGGTNLQLISDQNVAIGGTNGGAGGDVFPYYSGGAIDLGNASFYWGDVNYSDLIDRTPSPKFVHNALDKIKAIGTHVQYKKNKRGETLEVETLDRDTMPAEVIVPPQAEDYERAAREYNSRLKAKAERERSIKRLQEALSSPNKPLKQKQAERASRVLSKLINERARETTPKLAEPQPGISMNAQIGLIYSAIKELIDRIEQLESRK